MADTDIILVGGGLSNSLIAYRLHTQRPEVNFLLLEAGDELGGNHTWSFHGDDLSKPQLAWLSPFVEASWPGYEISFPNRQRDIHSAYFSISSSRLRDVMMDALGASVRLSSRVEDLTPQEVRLADGTCLRAGAVIDGRGGSPGHHFEIAYQKFLGREVRLSTPHGLDRPVLMDATVPQRDGFRFVYLLPFSDDRILIEDTYYSNVPALDRDNLRRGIDDYAAQRGWTTAELLREESGVLPIVLDGDIEAHWNSLDAGVPTVGLRGGFFHATTGYSLPNAVRIADLIACLEDFGAASLYELLRGEARSHWQQQGFYRMLNRMLFLAAKPEGRYSVLQRFYGLSAPLISRFYAGRTTLPDKLRILTGRPPIPIGAAIRATRALGTRSLSEKASS